LSPFDGVSVASALMRAGDVPGLRKHALGVSRQTFKAHHVHAFGDDDRSREHRHDEQRQRNARVTKSPCDYT